MAAAFPPLGTMLIVGGKGKCAAVLRAAITFAHCDNASLLFGACYKDAPSFHPGDNGLDGASLAAEAQGDAFREALGEDNLRRRSSAPLLGPAVRPNATPPSRLLRIAFGFDGRHHLSSMVQATSRGSCFTLGLATRERAT